MYRTLPPHTHLSVKHQQVRGSHITFRGQRPSAIIAVSPSNRFHGEVWLLWHEPRPSSPPLATHPLCSVCFYHTCTPPWPSTSTPPPHAHLDITRCASVISCISRFSSTPLPHSHIEINTPTSSWSHDALWVFSSCCFAVAEPAGFDLWFSVFLCPVQYVPANVFVYCCISAWTHQNEGQSFKGLYTNEQAAIKWFD